MNKNTEKTYDIKEFREYMDKYLDLSMSRLRTRLRSAWKKQTNDSIKQSLYEVKI